MHLLSPRAVLCTDRERGLWSQRACLGILILLLTLCVLHYKLEVMIRLKWGFDEMVSRKCLATPGPEEVLSKALK